MLGIAYRIQLEPDTIDPDQHGVHEQRQQPLKFLTLATLPQFL